MLNKKYNHKRPHTESFHLYEILRINKTVFKKSPSYSSWFSCQPYHLFIFIVLVIETPPFKIPTNTYF